MCHPGWVTALVWDKAGYCDQYLTQLITEWSPGVRQSDWTDSHICENCDPRPCSASIKIWCGVYTEYQFTKYWNWADKKKRKMLDDPQLQKIVCFKHILFTVRKQSLANINSCRVCATSLSLYRIVEAETFSKPKSIITDNILAWTLDLWNSLYSYNCWELLNFLWTIPSHTMQAQMNPNFTAEAIVFFIKAQFECNLLNRLQLFLNLEVWELFHWLV